MVVVVDVRHHGTRFGEEGRGLHGGEGGARLSRASRSMCARAIRAGSRACAVEDEADSNGTAYHTVGSQTRGCRDDAVHRIGLRVDVGELGQLVRRGRSLLSAEGLTLRARPRSARPARPLHAQDGGRDVGDLGDPVHARGCRGEDARRVVRPGGGEDPQPLLPVPVARPTTMRSAPLASRRGPELMRRSTPLIRPRCASAWGRSRRCRRRRRC